MDKKNQVTLHCTLLDGDRKKLVMDNLNFTMDPDTNQKLLSILGVDELNGHTPLMLKVFRPEGKAVDEWEQMAHPDNGNKQEEL